MTCMVTTLYNIIATLSCLSVLYYILISSHAVTYVSSLHEEYSS